MQKIHKRLWQGQQVYQHHRFTILYTIDSTVDCSVDCTVDCSPDCTVTSYMIQYIKLTRMLISYIQTHMF